MAFINGIYVFVESEDYTGDMEVSTHPVESGNPITDTVKKNPIEISISGAIVDYTINGNTIKAATTLSKIEAMKNAGSLITYNGRRVASSLQISSFSTGHGNEIQGGATFSMTLTECRIVSNSYVDPTVQDSSVKDGGNQQTDKGENEEVWYTVKKGDTIWGLVATSSAPYYNLKREGETNTPMGRCNWVAATNPQAFSNPKDMRTFQAGAKVLLGTR